ncbi:MAG: CvpA family protein [Betaproteobacteria bacterium]|nr:CvpA family protein [Betaproteobacteria bacterium]
MTVLDYTILAIIGISILLGMLRGLVREALNLLAWVAAFWVANAYTVEIAPLLPAAIPTESLRVLAAFVMLFLGALLLMSLVTIALAELVKTLKLGAYDKGLGALFGLMRGLLVVFALVLLSGLTSLPHQGFWRNAMFSAPLEALVADVKPWLPEGLSKRISYD